MLFRVVDALVDLRDLEVDLAGLGDRVGDRHGLHDGNVLFFRLWHHASSHAGIAGSSDHVLPSMSRYAMRRPTRTYTAPAPASVLTLDRP